MSRKSHPRAGAEAEATPGSAPTPGRGSLVKMLPAGVAAILVAPWLAAGISGWISPIAAIFVAVLFGFAVPMIVGLPDRAPAGGITLVIAAAASGIIGLSIFPYLLTGATVEGISVSQAPAHHEALLFHFTDGHVEVAREGSKAIRSRRGSTLGVQFVAPLVPEGWTPAQLVPAWVASSTQETHASTEAWKRNLRAGVRLSANGFPDEIAGALADAVAHHQLMSAPNAVVLRWCEKPDEELADARGQLVTAGLACAGAWLAIVLVEAVRNGARRRGLTSR